MLQQRDFSQCGHRNTVLGQGHPDLLQCHNFALIAKISSFVNRTVGTCFKKSKLFKSNQQVVQAALPHTNGHPGRNPARQFTRNPSYVGISEPTSTHQPHTHTHTHPFRSRSAPRSLSSSGTCLRLGGSVCCCCPRPFPAHDAHQATGEETGNKHSPKSAPQK